MGFYRVKQTQACYILSVLQENISCLDKAPPIVRAALVPALRVLLEIGHVLMLALLAPLIIDRTFSRLTGRFVNPQNLEGLWLIDDIEPGRVAIALEAAE